MEFGRTMRISAVAFALSGIATLAQTTSPGEGWARVQALPLQAEVRVASDHHHGANCTVAAVTEEQLTCAQRVFPRAEVRSVKLAHRGRSTGAGFLIGAGVGGGIGAGVGVASKSAFFVGSNAKAAGVGALLGIIIGGGAGALIGHGTDFTSKTVYKR